jgi:hypothetical protein
MLSKSSRVPHTPQNRKSRAFQKGVAIRARAARRPPPASPRRRVGREREERVFSFCVLWAAGLGFISGPIGPRIVAHGNAARPIRMDVHQAKKKKTSLICRNIK